MPVSGDPKGEGRTVVFIRTHLMMKRGRFFRLVMPELGPKVMKAEDGAQDTEGPVSRKTWQHVAAAW